MSYPTDSLNSVWDSQQIPAKKDWSHPDYKKNSYTSIQDKLTNLKAIHYCNREDACMHFVIIHYIHI